MYNLENTTAVSAIYGCHPKRNLTTAQTADSAGWAELQTLSIVMTAECALTLSSLKNTAALLANTCATAPYAKKTYSPRGVQATKCLVGMLFTGIVFGN